MREAVNRYNSGGYSPCGARMKRFLFSILLLAGIAAAPAEAADLSRKPVPPAPVAPAFTWTGAYVGLYAGGAFGSSRHDELTPPAATTGNFDVSGAVLGGTAGYNLQYGAWVFGAEADVGWNGLSGTSVCPNVGFTCKTEGSYLATLRGRVGYSFDRALIYVTGGGALAGVEQSFAPAFGGVSGKSFDKLGFAVGAGVEYALTPNWSVKAEYLYARFDDQRCAYACTGVAGQVLKVKLDENIVRLGVNYRFGSLF